MNRLHMLLATLSLSFLVNASLSANAQSWEYARLTTTTVGGSLVASWNSSEESLSLSGGLLPLAERLMGRLVPDTQDVTIVLFNFLGEQGWELVWVSQESPRTDYLFKRSVPSGLSSR